MTTAMISVGGALFWRVEKKLMVRLKIQPSNH